MITTLTQFLANPVVWKVVVGYWIFNAATTALPLPNGNKFYQFVYAFFHTLAGNLDKAAKSFNLPGN